MSFQSALSGLNSATRSLDVIGNNIANASTIGMKSSRAEFSDLVAASGGGGGSVSAGIGVEIAAVSQQFSQGNINITGNDLDVAINGGGFFELKLPDGSTAYTRNGTFKLDKLGNVVTNSGANVMGYPTDKTGKPTSATIQALKLPTNAPIGANPTSSITAEFNLNAMAPVAAGAPAAVGPPAVAAIAPTPRSTYGTSLNVYDSEGVATPVSLYFEKTATADTWDVFSGLDGAPLPTSKYASVGQIKFDASGKITGPVAKTGSGFSLDLPANSIAAVNPNIAGGTLSQVITVHLDNVTEYGSTYTVSNLTQDGYAPGELLGLKIGADGVIAARYSNGQTQSNGQVALADFRNEQGLTPTGSGNWIETFASGQPVQGAPGQGKFGALTSGALEESNIDLTAELVNMMTAQRSYQANAQTIKTQDQVMSTLVNLR
jgi:flagellar hook protein FlgE